MSPRPEVAEDPTGFWAQVYADDTRADEAREPQEKAQDGRELPGSTWNPRTVSDTLDALLAGTLERRQPTVGQLDGGGALFYAGKVNGIAGPSGDGKTWTALVACRQKLEAGRNVVYLDLEDDEADIVARLLEIGTRPDAIRNHFHYAQPDEPAGRRGMNLLLGTVDALDPHLVVIDSTGEGLSLEGANPNADEEVAAWFRLVPDAVARRGPGVVVLDHMTKAENDGLWPIGSQRKRAAITGVQYVQTVIRPFDRSTAGAAKLVCAKDRHGNYRRGQKVAELHATPGPDGTSFTLHAATQDDADETTGTWRPTALMERVSKALEDAREPLSFNALNTAVSGRRAHISAAVKALVDDEFVTVAKVGATSLHTSVKPYRQRTDPKSDQFAGEPLDAEGEPETGGSGSGSYRGEPGNHPDTRFREPVGNHREPGNLTTCRACSEPLDDVDGRGLHPNCTDKEIPR